MKYCSDENTYFIKIRLDESGKSILFETVTLPHISLDEIYEAIDCNCIDIKQIDLPYSTQNNKYPAAMILDDDGKIVDKAFNFAATALLLSLDPKSLAMQIITGCPLPDYIVGDVLIGRICDADLYGYSKEECEAIVEELGKNFYNMHVK